MFRASPVCAYIYPSDESFNLLETTFNINIKDDHIYLKSLKDRLPLLYDLLMAFSLESCLPVEFKPLIFKLIEKAEEPFRNGPIMDNCHQLNEMPMFFSRVCHWYAREAVTKWTTKSMKTIARKIIYHTRSLLLAYLLLLYSWYLIK